MKVAVLLAINDFIADPYYLKAHQYVGTQEVRKASIFLSSIQHTDLATDLIQNFYPWAFVRRPCPIIKRYAC